MHIRSDLSGRRRRPRPQHGAASRPVQRSAVVRRRDAGIQPMSPTCWARRPGTEISDTISTDHAAWRPEPAVWPPARLCRCFTEPAALQRPSASATTTATTLGAGLDWSTVERLSGNFTLNANQQQSDFIVGGVVPCDDCQHRSAARTSMPACGWAWSLRCRFDASLGTRRVSTSRHPSSRSPSTSRTAAASASATGPSGILTLGAGISGAAHTLPVRAAARPDRARPKRPAGLLLHGRLGAHRGQHRQCPPQLRQDSNTNSRTAADFDGVTGSLIWAWQAHRPVEPDEPRCLATPARTRASCV